ncbi:diguanylate cyclase [Babesia caballi]|uniref:Diguanylate cyclase n=1 Tax=Babesia caballi TaxID=5871 RepID=A0AAV4LL71_BABCB|nr:diguanylate cyclase [Babesia caballi]
MEGLGAVPDRTEERRVASMDGSIPADVRESGRVASNPAEPAGASASENVWLAIGDIDGASWKGVVGDVVPRDSARKSESRLSVSGGWRCGSGGEAAAEEASGWKSPPGTMGVMGSYWRDKTWVIEAAGSRTLRRMAGTDRSLTTSRRDAEARMEEVPPKRGIDGVSSVIPSVLMIPHPT